MNTTLDHRDVHVMAQRDPTRSRLLAKMWRLDRWGLLVFPTAGFLVAFALAIQTRSVLPILVLPTLPSVALGLPVYFYLRSLARARSELYRTGVLRRGTVTAWGVAKGGNSVVVRFDSRDDTPFIARGNAGGAVLEVGTKVSIVFDEETRKTAGLLVKRRLMILQAKALPAR